MAVSRDCRHCLRACAPKNAARRISRRSWRDLIRRRGNRQDLLLTLLSPALVPVGLFHSVPVILSAAGRPLASTGRRPAGHDPFQRRGRVARHQEGIPTLCDWSRSSGMTRSRSNINPRIGVERRQQRAATGDVH